jgi:hypothetical protein
MKTRKHFNVMAIIALAFAVIGCKQDVSPTPTPQAQPTVTIDGKTIPVYKTAGVSDADFNTIYTALKNANYDTLNDKAKAFMQGITRIEIGGTVITSTSNTLKIPSGVMAPVSLINGYVNSLAKYTPRRTVPPMEHTPGDRHRFSLTNQNSPRSLVPILYRLRWVSDSVMPPIFQNLLPRLQLLLKTQTDQSFFQVARLLSRCTMCCRIPYRHEPEHDE